MKGYRYELILIGLLVCVLGLAGVLDPSFLKIEVQLELSREIWELALLALGMTLIIITGGIDLSVGSAMGICSVALGLAMHGGLPVPVCIVICLLTGVAAGSLNGVLVTKIKVHPLLVTLATYGMYRGFAEGLQGATTNAPVEALPDLKALFAGTFPLVPVLCVALAIAAGLVLSRTVAGRTIRAIGHNESAARFSGLAVDRLKFALYGATGFLAAVAALGYSARRSATAEAGMGLELDVITAVVVGGTSIYGGRGRILGTVLGVLLIHEARQFVDWHWQQAELTLIVIGSLLILSVLGHRLLFRVPGGR
jgi:rhamnose transport system permease protein